MNIKFSLADQNLEIIEAWKKELSKLTEEQQSIFEIWLTDDVFSKPMDCVVSPANSFGFMDGGFDYVLTRYFGGGLSANIQEFIKEMFSGELFVGESLLVRTGDENVPYCICAPTMRTPQNISQTINVYLATSALLKMLKEVHEDAGITIVRMTGLGTGVGGVSPEMCAYQMFMAFKDIWFEQLEYPKTLLEAMDRENEIKNIVTQE